MTAQGTIYEDYKRQLCREWGIGVTCGNIVRRERTLTYIPGKSWQKLRRIRELEGVSPETEY